MLLLDLASFRAALNRDPKYIPKSPVQIGDDFRKYVTQMHSKLSKLFNEFPQTPLTVEAVPDSQPGNPTHYFAGTPDGSRPARVVVATPNHAHRRLLSDETIAYHEGIPGHHLQISIQAKRKDLPEFRQHLFSAAFADGWSREQAVAYFRMSGSADEPTIKAEVDRYIAWPAQDLSYMIGQLKILKLRQLAQKELGSGFDIRQFHDEILSAGNLPLNILEERVNSWLAAKHRSQSSGVQP